MSTEAKISLAVGLSFIICFAIVLTNRGRPLGPAVADRGTGDATQPPRSASSPIRLQDRVREGISPKGNALPATKLDNTRGDGSKRLDSTPTRRRIPIKPKRLAQQAETPPGSAFTRADIELSSEPIAPAAVERNNDSPVVMGPPDRSPSKRADDRSSTPRAGDAAPYAILATHETDPRSIEKPTIDRPSIRTPQSAAKKPAKSRPTPSKTTELRHTVLEGESLWSIVQKNYGRATGRLLSAVFEANRATLDSPDHLKVGVSLLLPEVNGHAPLANRSKTVGDGPRGRTAKPTGHRSNDREGKTNRSNGRRSPKQGGEERLAWRWYQVAEGDRYTTIAANELGNAKQWPMLFELNKDIFPDPDRIRGGVNIRIPLAGSN